MSDEDLGTCTRQNGETQDSGDDEDLGGGTLRQSRAGEMCAGT